MSIVVFYHAWLNGASGEIIPQQLQRLKSSGLYDKAEEIRLHTSDNAVPITGMLTNYPKIALRQNRDKFSELDTLRALHDYACTHPGKQVLYMHTKGASKYYPPVNDWRRMMEYFLIDKYEDCLKTLDCCDVLGVNYMGAPKPHLSGNFWWATTDYLKRLKPLGPAASRTDAEFWVLSENKHVVANVHSSNVNHYCTPYPHYQYGGPSPVMPVTPQKTS